MNANVRFVVALWIIAVLSFAAEIAFAHAASADMPACCRSPKNSGDERCFAARFHYPPGTSASDPGTWTGYSTLGWRLRCAGN
jgi:hypothetical protein